MTSTDSASVVNQESARQKDAVVNIKRYCMEQIGFSQRNIQEIPTLFSFLAAQVKVPVIVQGLTAPFFSIFCHAYLFLWCLFFVRFKHLFLCFLLHYILDRELKPLGKKIHCLKGEMGVKSKSKDILDLVNWFNLYSYQICFIGCAMLTVRRV